MLIVIIVLRILFPSISGDGCKTKQAYFRLTSLYRGAHSYGLTLYTNTYFYTNILLILRRSTYYNDANTPDDNINERKVYQRQLHNSIQFI